MSKRFILVFDAKKGLQICLGLEVLTPLKTGQKPSDRIGWITWVDYLQAVLDLPFKAECPYIIRHHIKFKLNWIIYCENRGKFLDS